MDQNQTNQDAGEENEVNPEPQEEQNVEQETPSADSKKSMGPTVGIIVIVIVLVLGGFYYWVTQTQEGGDEITVEEIVAQEDVALTALQEQSTSDEVADIEADLAGTDLEGLDAELDQIEQELSI